MGHEKNQRRGKTDESSSVRVSNVVEQPVDACGGACGGQPACDDGISITGNYHILFCVLFCESMELAQSDHESMVVPLLVHYEFVLGMGTRRVAIAAVAIRSGRWCVRIAVVSCDHSVVVLDGKLDVPHVCHVSS